MYPFNVILLGCTETELPAIRRGLANLSIHIEGEFATTESMIAGVPTLANMHCLFIARINSPADLKQLTQIQRRFAGKPIVALMNLDTDAQALISTLRCGASQILLLPLHPEDLKVAMENVALQSGLAVATSKVLAVSGVTEGCGATTVAINLGYEIATQLEMSCIVTELSVGIGRLSNYLAADPMCTTGDFLNGSGPLDADLVKRALVKVTDNLHIVAGPHLDLDARAASAVQILQFVDLLKHMADVIVVDMPYAFDKVYLDTVSAVNQVVLIGEQTVPSVRCLKLVNEALGMRAEGVKRQLVINRFVTKDPAFSVTHLKEILQTDTLMTISDDPAGCKGALNCGVPLRTYAPGSRVLKNINSLARLVVGAPKTIDANTGAGWFRQLLHSFSNDKDEIVGVPESPGTEHATKSLTSGLVVGNIS